MFKEFLPYMCIAARSYDKDHIIISYEAKYKKNQCVSGETFWHTYFLIIFFLKKKYYFMHFERHFAFQNA